MDSLPFLKMEQSSCGIQEDRTDVRNNSLLIPDPFSLAIGTLKRKRGWRLPAGTKLLK